MAYTKQIWDDFGGRLRGFIATKVNDRDDADDILQDVFYKIHSGINSLGDENRLQSWIYRIARNTIVDFYRDRARQKKPDSVPAETIVHPAEDDVIDPLLSCLRPLVDQLPQQHRVAIEATEFEGLSQKQLAARLGISVSGAKSRVQRARNHIKDIMLACCHFEFDTRGAVINYERRPEGCSYCAGDDCS
jgi:RNA polymerase sigma-70 factor (ECF subfamily)